MDAVAMPRAIMQAVVGAHVFAVRAIGTIDANASRFTALHQATTATAATPPAPKVARCFLASGPTGGLASPCEVLIGVDPHSI